MKDTFLDTAAQTLGKYSLTVGSKQHSEDGGAYPHFIDEGNRLSLW